MVQRGGMVCSKRLMNSLSSVMLRLPLLSSPTVASCMSSAAAIGNTHTNPIKSFVYDRFCVCLCFLVWNKILLKFWGSFVFWGVLIFFPLFHGVLKVCILLVVKWLFVLVFSLGVCVSWVFFFKFLVALLCFWFSVSDL